MFQARPKSAMPKKTGNTSAIPSTVWIHCGTSRMSPFNTWPIADVLDIDCRVPEATDLFLRGASWLMENSALMWKTRSKHSKNISSTLEMQVTAMEL